MTQPKTPITVAFGDGIGPEIMQATLYILIKAGAKIEIEPIEIGEKIYTQGYTAGIEPKAWESLQKTKVFLKAPITTPEGGGFKSLNVTVRKTLGLYANIRPCKSYAPYIDTLHPNMDVVIIRENEEDLYAGIEHQQTPEVVQCLKLITVPGCEKIIRYAFEYARQHQRSKVTCFTKDNIMKLTDGLFHRIFNEIAEEYPDINHDHRIVDIGAAKLADAPEQFDVIVMPNLYGDILSDVAAEIAGSVGIAGSANIGEHVAMFEAIHGSAPHMGGQNRANPSGLLEGAIMMLVHIGQPEVASLIRNAWLKTIEDGIHTYDIFNEKLSKQRVGTKEFAQAVVDRLGELPTTYKPVHYQAVNPITKNTNKISARNCAKRTLVGVDVFVYQAEKNPDLLAAKLQKIDNAALQLKLITNRGVKVWPDGMPETFCTDHWRCRFKALDGIITNQVITELLSAMTQQAIEFIKIENLYEFDGNPGYSLGQGE